ncbi:MAG: glycosyltransferase family 4 protein [Chloroflexi bacterium]|nr:glycosyltransferase family 4 protein [Chloroflexota bacterium]
MTHMRIAMVGPFGFHPNKTMRSRALGLARPLAARGHVVQIFMPPWHTPAEADKTWQEDGVFIRNVPLSGGTPGITHRLTREVLAWQPDVVHCFKPKAYSGLVAWWLWQFHRRQVRLVVDSDDWEGWGGWNDLAPYSRAQKQLFARQERWGLTHCHALTVASRALQTLAWGHGAPPERVVYVPNGAGIGEQGRGERGELRVNGEPGPVYHLKEEPQLLLYSRLFEFETERLVAILRGVKTAVPQLHILAVGAGLYQADAAQFRQQLAAADLLDAVEDVGWIDEAALPALLRRADVGIYLMEDTLLNRAKCPVKLADMVALGIPIVGEAVGQVSEYVLHGQTGLLRSPGDIPGLTADLIHLLTQPQERDRLAANGRRHYAAHFAWPHLADLVEQAYRQP